MSWSATAVAALACLQPGIDPVFLALVTNANAVPLDSHGLIVGITQAGAAVGSLAVWRFGGRLPRLTYVGAATAATSLSLITPTVDSLATLLFVRVFFGLAMGMVYARAMADCTRHDAYRAFGGMFLIQLMLATVVSALLPQLELLLGAKAALTVLAIVPASACFLLLTASRSARDAFADLKKPAEQIVAPVPSHGWALAAATLLFVCGTMIVWSFVAALAAQAMIPDAVIGYAVAAGSVAGAGTALLVMRSRLLLPFPVLALLSSACLAAPVLLTSPDAYGPFVGGIILLNIGSTAAIVRASSLAAATSRDSRFQTLVACTHNMGMIFGPLLGTLCFRLAGSAGLLTVLAVIVATALAFVVWACLRQGNWNMNPKDA